MHTEVYAISDFFWEQLEQLERTATVRLDPAYQEAFERLGVTFSEGASVKFDGKKSQLIVRATKAQQSRIVEILNRMQPNLEPRASVQFEEILVTPELLADSGFDWLEPREGLIGARTPGVRRLASREALFEEFSHPPVVEKKREISGIDGILGVFTEPQFAIARKALLKKGVEFCKAPVATVRSGEAAVVQEGAKRWGVVPTFREYTLNLDLFLPAEGEALFQKGDSPEPTVRVMLWDGQVVAWGEKQANGTIRVVFTTVTLVDAAGNPLNGKSEPTP